MRFMRIAPIAVIAAVVLAGCTSEATSAPETVTRVETVTEQQTTTVTETSEVTVSDEPTVEPVIASTEPTLSSADAAACRLILPALEQSEIEHYVDQITAGVDVDPLNLSMAGEEFARLIGSAPTSASNDILAPLLGFTVIITGIQDSLVDGVADPASVESSVHAMPAAVQLLHDACN